MDKVHFSNNHKSSFSERVSSNRLYHLPRNLIRFSILLIAIFLLFSVTANDETQIAYASENLTDLELESANLHAINDNQTTSETSNSSFELIDPSGTVTSWTGYPISDLTVSAWQGSQLISQTVTDNDGGYNLDLTPGTYNLTAGGIATGGEEQKEYLTQTQQIDVQEPVTVNFQGMLLKNSVYGVITDENGNPLPYTMAEIYDDEGNCIDDNDAGTDGNYKLDLNYYFSQQDPSVTSGNFWVVFYGDQFLEQEFNVQVNRDEAYRLDVVMQNATILQGTVTGQSTAIDEGTDETCEVIMYFTDPNGNEGTDYCSISNTKNYYFQVDPSLVTVHHIGLAVYGYQDYYQPISLTSGQVNIHNITLVEKGIITVNVTNSTNQPLSGASVSVQSDSFNYLLYTDTDGMLSFAVEDDDWTVCATYPDDDYVKVVKNLTVSGGGITLVDIILIQSGLPVVMEGYVTDALDGSPLASAWITFWPSTNPTQTWTRVRTDANGYYKITTDPNQPDFVSGASGYLEIEPIGHEKPRIFITIGQEGQGQNIYYDVQLAPYTGSITVYTKDINDQPVSGVTVDLWGDEDQEMIPDAEGKVVFERVGPSEWWELYIYDYNDNYYTWDSYYYPLEDGQNLEVTAYLIPTTVPAEIKGSVLDPDGAPVSNAKVELYLINSGNWIFTWNSKTTDSLGYFSLNLYGTSANLMRVIISKLGYQNVTYDFLPGDLPVNQNFLLNLESLTEPVSGYVYDYLGNPLQGVQIEALENGANVATFFTDLSGEFNFELPASNYQLIVSHPGYLSQSDDFNLAVGGEYQVNFELLKNGSLYGVITGFQNAPVNGATVNLIQNSNVIDSTISNANGQYQTNSLNQGAYIVQIEAPYYEIVEHGPFIISDATASYQSFVMQPTAASSIQGQLTDEVTGLPIPNANVALYYGEDSHTECISDQNGFYSFQNILPRDYYMEFSATNYIDGNANIQIGLGQNELNKTLEAIIPGTIKGNVSCWSGPVLGAIVTLDGLNSITTGTDGSFQFENVNMGWHQVIAEMCGITTSWFNYLANGEVKSLEFYLNLAQILNQTPSSGAIVNQINEVRVKIQGAKPEAEAASIYVYHYVLPNPQAWWYVPELIPGTITKDNDWLIFTPETSFGYGTHTVQVKVGTELDQSYDFYIYPVTNIAPFILSFNPSDGSFFRDPGSIELSANVQNNPGNGLSAINSYISVDGTVLPTTISMQSIDAYACLWKLQATVDSLGHGWHNIKVSAVDNQGLRNEINWSVFVSRATTFTISNVQAPLFSVYTGGMRITADISEPIRAVRLYLDSYPDWGPIWLGDFNDKINATWDGYLSYPTITLPDGTYSFVIYGETADGWFHFTPVAGSTQIDSTSPELNTDSKVYYDNRDLTIHGSVYDPSSGISTFEAVTSGGTLETQLSGGIFNLDLHVENDGQYTVTITASDLAGNVANLVKTIWVDTVAPTISFISPEVGSEVRPGQALSFQLGDDFTGLNRDYITYHPLLTPLSIEITLDGTVIKDQVNYLGDLSYGFEEYNAAVYGWAASLLGITGTYDPKLNGYLTDGNHTLNITLQDMAGNKIEKILKFSSITKKPDVTEKNMSMTVNNVDQTLYFSGDVHENSDRGIKNIRLFLDGAEVLESMVLTWNGDLYGGTASWTITRNFTSGPHTIVLHVIDNLDLENSLHTGFYYLPNVPLNNSDFANTTDILPSQTGYHGDGVRLDPSTYFKQGNQALLGYCFSSPDPSDIAEETIVYAQSAYVDASNSTDLSLWMTDLTYFRWNNPIFGAAGFKIEICFDDGNKRIPNLNDDFDHDFSNYNNKFNWIENWNQLSLTNDYIYSFCHVGLSIETYYQKTAARSEVGADGKTWKQFIFKIPDGVDKSHLSVVITWSLLNHQDGYYNFSSKVDNVEFITSLVSDFKPIDGSVGVGLQPVVSANYTIPLDPVTFNTDTFYLKDNEENKVATINNYDESADQGIMIPLQKLNGNTKYTVYVSPDIRTIYGRILPEPLPYEWSFTTREGESSRWQSIWYNGEQYDIYLTFGPGYNGYMPGYISPSTIAIQAGAPLLGIYVTKNGYEIADMELKKMIFLAAERNAFYESSGTMGGLIDSSIINYVNYAANSILADVAYYDYIHFFGGDTYPPDSEDVIRASIARALADGFDQTHVPGYITNVLSWFKMGLTGADKVNTAIGKLREMQDKTSDLSTQKAIGKTIKIFSLVDGEITFSMELAEYTFQLLWELEVADYYRPQLTFIRDHSSGDTRTAINQLLNWDKENVELRISEKIVEHIQDQTIALTKEAIEDELMATPAAPAIILKKVISAVVDYLGVFDAHSEAHIAVDLAVADGYFCYARNAALNSLPTYHITPDDLSRVSTTSRMWYSTAADFFDTMSTMVTIIKGWPSLITGTDENSLNQAIASYNAAASNYHSHASNMIPELLTSNSDINTLFSLIRSGTTGKLAYIQIGAHSPIALLVIDELGRRIGYDPVTGQNVNDFAPDGGYTGPYTEPQLIGIPALSGQLTIQAFGTGTGTYTIDLETYDENGLLISGSTWTGTAVPGVTQIFTLAVDGLGDVFPVDSHPPEITVNGISEGTSYTSPVTPEIIVVDDNLESWYATLNGVNYTGGSVSAEGVYNLFIRATDGINVVYKTMQFSIDLTPPQINILGFTDGDYSPMVLPYVKVIDENLATINLKLDGIDYVEDPVRTEGQHTFTAVATDNAGHQTTASATFTIDHTNPTINIQGLTDGTIYTGSVTPTININDLNLASTNILLDGNTYNSGTPITNTLHHNLTINATDKAGNQATQEIWFTIIPPGGSIINATGGTTTPGQVNLNFPNGALDEDTVITMNDISGTSNPANFLFAGHAFDITAVNLHDGSQTNQLNQPVLITFHYLDSDIAGLEENTLQIFYWNTTTSTWEALPSVVDTENNIVTAYIGHLSIYALMGRPIQEPSNPNTPENQPVQTSTTTQQNSGTTQNSSIISGYPTSNLLISAPLTLQSPSSAATVPAQQQQPNTGETTPGINNWIIYALVFLVAVTLIVLLIKRIIKS